jgi:hypothetical protein
MCKVTSGERPARPKRADADYSALPSDTTWSLIESCWAQDRASRPRIGQVVRQVGLLVLCALVIRIIKLNFVKKALLDNQCCVTDTDDMYQRLTDWIRGMSSDSIIRSNDEAATRAKILEGIQALRAGAPFDIPTFNFWWGLISLHLATPTPSHFSPPPALPRD